MTPKPSRTVAFLAVLAVVALLVVDATGTVPVLEPVAGAFWTVVFWVLVLVVLALLVREIFPTP